MRKLLLAMLLLLVAVATRSEAQTYAYAATTRFITTTGAHCGSSATSCNIIGTGAAFHNLTWNVTGTLSACSVRVDSSADGITWGSGDIIAAQTCTSNGNALSTSHVVNYVRVNVTTITPVSTASLTVNLTGYINAPSGGGTVTNVSATTPLASSGGATPNITCIKCDYIKGPTNKAANYTIVTGDDKTAFILDSGGGGADITLPSASQVAGWSVRINNIDTVPWNLILGGSRTLNNTFDSVSPFIIGSLQSVFVYSDGTEYFAELITSTFGYINSVPLVSPGQLNFTNSNNTIALQDNGDGVDINLPDNGSVPYSTARIRAVAQVAAIGTATITTTGANDSSFIIVAEVYCTTASAAATVTLHLSYTDVSNTVQTIVPTAATCTTLGASSLALVNTPITAKAATAIQYSTTIANTPTYDLRIQLFHVTSN